MSARVRFGQGESRVGRNLTDFGARPLVTGVVLARHQREFAAGQQRRDHRAVWPVARASADGVLPPPILFRIEWLEPAEFAVQFVITVWRIWLALDRDEFLPAVAVEV